MIVAQFFLFVVNVVSDQWSHQHRFPPGAVVKSMGEAGSIETETATLLTAEPEVATVTLQW